MTLHYTFDICCEFKDSPSSKRIVMREKPFVDSVLLHAYSLDKFGLMYGKMGCVLCLFEYSRLFHYELAEKHAFELLQEVLASSLSKNEFGNGKMGIAWSLMYLIKNQFVDADYLELYGKEHDEIMAYIKHLKSETLNFNSKVDSVYYLTNIGPCLSNTDFIEILSTILNSLYGYFEIIPKNVFECNTFYYVGTKILAYYSCYKDLYFEIGKLIDVIVRTHLVLIENGYVCNNLSFAVNLLQYAISNKSDDLTILSNSIIKCFITNIVCKTLNLREIVDAVYNINRLQILVQNNGYLIIKDELSSLMYDRKSYLYNIERSSFNTFKEGIPRLLFMLCLKDKSLNSEGHLIMF